MAGFVFHLPAAVLRGDEAMKPFYRKLLDGLAERGHPVSQIAHDRARLVAQVAAADDLHIVDHGNIRHPQILNTGIAYVYPFWNIDPWGIRALSSVAGKAFDPATVDPVVARGWADRQRRRLIAGRVSRYPQPTARQDLPRGAIAVFLQADAHRAVADTFHLTSAGMIAALLARDDPAPILIKPHPLDPDPGTRARVAAMTAGDSRVRIVDANIHDMLSAASAVVTINSAVGIEAMLHHRGVVLCGHSDFHHAAVTVRTAAQMDAAIARARAADWPHDAFVYWYLVQNCLNAGSETLVPDFLARTKAFTSPSAPVHR